MISLKPTGLLRKLWLKLMISYAVATMLALVAGTLVNGMFEDYRLRKWLKPKYQIERATEVSKEIVPWLDPSSRDGTALTLWLERQEEELKRWQRELAPALSYYLDRRGFGKRQRNMLLITDQNGVILAGTGEAAEWKNQTVWNRFSGVKVKAFIDPARAMFLAVAVTIHSGDGENTFLAVPVRDRKLGRLGTLVLQEVAPPNWYATMLTLLSDLLRDAVAVIMFAGLFGLLFGWLMGWHLTSRINRIAVAARAWSSGEFSALADDKSADELGRLAERLNAMARQLRETFDLRQKLTASEERNRLARDLHDTVKQQISILIVDDHAVVRQGVIAFLTTQPDITVVGEAATGEEAIKACIELAPDVVLMDLLMTGLDGIEATRQIRQVSPRTQIIILTSYHEDEHILPAIRAGALSYLLKDVSPRELVEAVRKAARQEVTLHSKIASRIMNGLRRAESVSEDPLLDDLSNREIEVLRLIAEGLPNAEIARRLFISEKTVKSHVSNLLGKLHLADRTQAAVYAWRTGLAS